LYVGSTGDLPQRLRQHEDGRAAAWTSARRPVRLLFSEDQPSLVAALARERQIKRWTRAKKLALAAGDYDRLRRL
jgi:predicted GIY-YIG superfamily endonuclease